MRSCYSSTWKLFKGSEQHTRGHYYFVSDDVPFYAYSHNLGSKNWVSDEYNPPPLLGEVPGVARPYRKGSLPIAPPPARLVGTSDCISNGETYPLPVIARTLIAGIDSRCWTDAGLPVPVTVGGDELDSGDHVGGVVSQVAGGELDSGSLSQVSGGGELDSGGIGADGGGELDSGSVSQVSGGEFDSGSVSQVSGGEFDSGSVSQVSGGELDSGSVSQVSGGELDSGSVSQVSGGGELDSGGIGVPDVLGGGELDSGGIVLSGGGTLTACCPGIEIPEMLTLAIDSGSCMGSYPLHRIGPDTDPDWVYSGILGLLSAGPPDQSNIGIGCHFTSWVSNGVQDFVLVSVSCWPFVIEFTLGPGDNSGGGVGTTGRITF